MNIGIIGNGNIASYLLRVINHEQKVKGKVIAVFGRNKRKGMEVSKRYKVKFFTSYEQFIQQPIDIVVEVASTNVAKQYIKQTLKNEKDVIIGSIGALQDNTFLKKIIKVSEEYKTKIHLPSGAIGGLDLIQSANAQGGLQEVNITTVKSPRSLGKEVEKAKTLYDGPAQEAIEQFPKNVNVAVALSIAGIGIKNTNVVVKVDPKIDNNMHILHAKGEFGEMELKVKNNPMLQNPKTSYLAALSILSTLKNTNNLINIGP